MSADPIDPLARVLRVGFPAAIGLLIAAAVLGWVFRGSAGAWGGFLGAAVPAVFLGITAAVGVRARRVDVRQLGFFVLGSWLVKLVLLIAFLAWLRQQDWFDRPVFFVVLLVGTAGLLGLEGWLVSRSPQLYVTPSAK